MIAKATTGFLQTALTSLLAKAALIVALTVGLVVSVLTYQSTNQARGLVIDALQEFSAVLNDQAATRAAGATRFRKVEDLEPVLQQLLETAEGEAQHAATFDAEGLVIAEVGSGDAGALSALVQRALATGETVHTADYTMVATPIRFGAENEVIGAFASAWTLDSAMARINGYLLWNIAVASVIFAICLGAATWLLHRLATRPMRAISDAIGTMRDGDYEVEIPGCDRRDEIGIIGNSLAALSEKLIEGRTLEERNQERQAEQARVVDQIAASLQSLADGDLTATIDTPFAAEYEPLRLGLNDGLARLGASIRGALDAANNVRNGSRDIAAAAESLATRTETQAAALEQTAAALDGMAGQVDQTATDARNIAGIVGKAKNDGARSDEIVETAVAAMAEIRESSDHISNIIGVIDDIAFQTNLLALNAGVEAARAGAAGKGFAVVASEVQALARRSADAAREIKDLIAASASQVERGTSLVDDAGQALKGIVEQIGHISELIGGIAENTQQQSGGLAEVNQSVTQLEQVTQNNAAMVEQSTAATQALDAEAAQLSQLMQRFVIPATPPVSVSRAA